jgi:hypothetical protein
MSLQRYNLRSGRFSCLHNIGQKAAMIREEHAGT